MLGFLKLLVLSEIFVISKREEILSKYLIFIGPALSHDYLDNGQPDLISSILIHSSPLHLL